MYSSEAIKTKDGHWLSIRIYTEDRPYNTVILIAPSAGLSQKTYEGFANYFSQQGFSVVTFDYRGVGESAPVQLKGYEANLQQWAVKDIDTVIRRVKQHFPQQELIVLGHGIGGEMIGLAAASQYIDRLVLVNAALSCSRLRNKRDRLWIGFMKIFIRIISKLLGYFPGKYVGFVNNIPKGVMNEWVEWCDNDNGLFDTYPDHNYRKLVIPLLSISFDDDWRSQQKGVMALLEHFQNACIEAFHYMPKQIGLRKVGHRGFFKVSYSTKLWPPLLNWLNNKSYCDCE